MKRNAFAMVIGSALLCSCGLYHKYESTSQVPDNVYGEQRVDMNSNIADTEWQQMFTDAQLQACIRKALASNTEAKTALMRIRQAEINYKASRLAYLPTLAFAPTTQGVYAHGSGSEGSYDIVAQASWQLDIFGAQTTNSKRKTKASLKYAQDYEQAVQCRLISTVATLYYELLALDAQTGIQREMIKLYEQTYDYVQTLFESGVYMSPAVNQTKAQLDMLRVKLIELENAIEVTEHALCEVLDEPYHSIDRSTLTAVVMPEKTGTGIPADLLRLRPDVRVAERNIEMAYYDVQLSRGALYPSLTLTASTGWTGLYNADPMTWFVQGVGSLTQPLFMGGRLRADLKVSKIEQQIAVEEFRKTVIKAGHEVTIALGKCRMAADKEPHLRSQVAALNDAVMASRELMSHGTTTHLEVLSAMQELLQTQTALVDNKAAGMKALVALYAALGGR